MAKKLESPTSLTQFAPLSHESVPKTFSVWSLFKRLKTDKDSSCPEKSADDQNLPSSETDPLPIFQKDVDESISDSCCSSDTYNENRDIPDNRNMTNILKVIKNMMEGKRMGLQNYKDSDFKQYWMPDSNCKECYECGDRFTTFRRRHHCRVCGQIFCRRCCNQEIPGNIIGYTGDLRVCTYCFRMVTSYMQSLDSSADVSEDLQSFHSDLQHRIQNLLPVSDDTTTSHHTGPTSARRKSSVIGFREEDIAKAKPTKMLSDFHCNIDYDSSASFEASWTFQNLTELFSQLMQPINGISYAKNHQQAAIHKLLCGCDIVDWLINKKIAKTRAEAIRIGQFFLDANLLTSLDSESVQFVDGNVFYIPRQHFESTDNQRNALACESQENMEPLWVKEIQSIESCNLKGDSIEDSQQSCIQTDDECEAETRSRISSSSSMFYLDLDLKESRVSVSRPLHRTIDQKPLNAHSDDKSSLKDVKDAPSEIVNLDFKYFNEGMPNTLAEKFLKAFKANQLDSSMNKTFIASQDWTDLLQHKNDVNSKSDFDALNAAFAVHENNLLRQLLSTEGLSLTWCDIILPIAHRVIDAVHPDVKNDADDMDIRQYVQFKKIPGGIKTECTIVSGVVFSKTVAHRKMSQNILQPTILLLNSSIAYQRTENKLSSLDPVLMQEFEYLKNTIGKLTVVRPDVLLVEKTVSRLAQEMLLHLGITVAINVKPTVMERIARCTRAAIVSTVDAHLGRPQLGTCQHFKVKTYSLQGGKIKTLMFFDGCAANLGCTILLRGGSSSELKKVKQITQFMVYVAYNWKLERSFFMDEFAVPPPNLYEQFACDDTENELEEVVLVEMSFIASSNNEATVEGNQQNMPSHGDSPFNSYKTNTDNEKKLKFDDSVKKLETKCIDDFSDPLHSYLRLESSVATCDSSDILVSSSPTPATFRKLLDDVILCCSLNVKVNLPYLETDTGKNCSLRRFFPSEIYWSARFSKGSEPDKLQSAQSFGEENTLIDYEVSSINVEVIPSHKFNTYKFTSVWDMCVDTQALLSDFRARGGTLRYLCTHECEAKEKKVDAVNYNEKEEIKVNDVSSDRTVFWEKQVDALDPYNHQRLAVLFCSYSCTSNNAPNYCVNPWVVKMDFYGCNDIPLGGFLERYCFRSSYVCPSPTCDTSMTDHVRKFVHECGCIHIRLHELSSGVQTSKNNVLMWSWCHKCKQATPVVSMSQETWSFSFAKYLELRFHAYSYYRKKGADSMCMHSLHHDHYQYFAHENIVAIFEYTPVIVWEIALPPLVIIVQDASVPVTAIVEEIKYIAIKGYGVYSSVLEKLLTLREEYSGTNSEDIISNLISAQKLDMAAFREKIEEIQLRLTSPALENAQVNMTEKNHNKDVCSFMWKITDQVTVLKQHIAEAVYLWNNRIQDLLSVGKKEEKLPVKTSPPIKTEEVPAYVTSNVCGTSASSVKEETEDVSEKSNIFAEKIAEQNSECSFLSNIKTVNDVLLSHLPNNKNECYAINLAKPKFLYSERSSSCEKFYNCDRISNFPSRLYKAFSEPADLAYTTAELSISKNFTDDEKNSLCSSGSSYTYGVTPGIYAGLVVPEPEDDESYVICHKDVLGSYSEKSSIKGHERSKSEGNEISGELLLRSTREPSATMEDSGAIKKDKKELTVKTLISQYLSNKAVDPIQSPFLSSQHILLPKTEKIPVIVYDDEPSSIIAYTLTSSEYEEKLQELKLNISSAFGIQRESQTSSPLLKRRQNSRVEAESNSGSESPLHGNEEASNFMDMTLCSSQETEKIGHKGGGNKTADFHLEIQFSDTNAKFYCRVYYAEQFRKLRCLVFSEGEDRFIRSLSRCIPWIARGGKSGSTFCKTHDDRFILKQMQKLELQSFLDLAPSYFQYLNKACLEQKPTLLAKIVGVYRIGYKNTATNTAMKMDLLVMENLFYGCNISKKYDLKGSIRNRLVNTSGLQEDDIVLLDENLLKITCDNPLYVRPHSKTVLTQAISNDTQFLSDQSVMDYSLLVGLNEEKKELVVGIIDFIRTFTWDKRVEMIVKSSGILGGHGKLPTVVQPEIYRVRFCEAMDGYFLWVPDRWTKLSKGIDG